ncbi:hypothetical protein [Fimbriimonas ginsengisoli]|uniref:Uncharacterized protein n=1 Tax=Fimbriimonas ginsengisoli Gsoil 348 TaxID=661478 RepID=A0A068NM92_FIMGI|nr:hypothetical protein [Fimbriimonas ginsengisoli]AIE84532.1 hypothetical protein OP10G_1164 [Fimbriimonas ginsengisoli Gsoil 348]
MKVDLSELSAYPGGDLVAQGIEDLANGITSEPSLLVMVATERLRGLGLPVPVFTSNWPPYEHRLFLAIEARNPGGAHAEYNALLGRLTSFTQSYTSHK